MGVGRPPHCPDSQASVGLPSSDLKPQEIKNGNLSTWDMEALRQEKLVMSALLYLLLL